MACLLVAGIAKSDSYCVKKPGARLYSVANENSKVVWRAPKYTPLLGTGNRKDKMIEVTDVDSQKFWIARKLVSSKLSCLVVRVTRSKLRSGPGPDYAVAKMKYADKYEAFVDLGGEDGWTQVRDETGSKAWIDLDNVWKPMSKMRISFDGK